MTSTNQDSQLYSSLPPPAVDTATIHPNRLYDVSQDLANNRTRTSLIGHGHRSRSSSSRSRSRHRHSSRRHQSRQRCRMYFKHKERNFIAASFSMVAIVLLCTALEPDWIYMNGGGCHVLHSSKGSLHHLSTNQFFFNGHFYKHYPFTSNGDHIYQYGSNPNDVMVNCVTYSAVLLFKASIAFTLIAVLCNLMAFLLDLVGPSYQLLKLLRRNAIFNILSVVMCVTINLFVYWITKTVDSLQQATRVHLGSKVEVTFHVSFYLVTAAGAVSVIATACNCLRRHTVFEAADPIRPADCYYDDTESLLPPPSPSVDSAPLSSLPPPPAYSP